VKFLKSFRLTSSVAVLTAVAASGYFVGCAETADDGGSCSLADNTTATTLTSANGCAVLTRDTSSCEASRTAQGLSGFWLKYSCNVTLTKTGDTVTIATDSVPDRKSPYFGSADSCYEALSVSGRAVNPNLLAEQGISMTVDYTPTASGSTATMPGGAVGVTLDGVVVYDNEAAPGDSIYAEVDSFDKCEGHPDNSSTYHYHTEPTSITNADSKFVGVMRDGFAIYGKKDADGSTPSNLDAAGGHTGTTVDSTTAVYHYHINTQTSGSDSADFLTKGLYRGTAGTCTGC
jgi:hypothetical protein